MSGRRLGRLFGSLLVLAALWGGLGGVDLSNNPQGDAQTVDVIWQ